jgi:hypothetical protein
MVNSRIPPAIMKSATVMPRDLSKDALVAWASRRRADPQKTQRHQRGGDQGLKDDGAHALVLDPFGQGQEDGEHADSVHANEQGNKAEPELGDAPSLGRTTDCLLSTWRQCIAAQADPSRACQDEDVL